MNNISEKGVRTIHKAKVYTSFQRPEKGVRLIYGCVLYTQNYGKGRVRFQSPLTDAPVVRRVTLGRKVVVPPNSVI